MSLRYAITINITPLYLSFKRPGLAHNTICKHYSRIYHPGSKEVFLIKGRVPNENSSHIFLLSLQYVKPWYPPYQLIYCRLNIVLSKLLKSWINNFGSLSPKLKISKLFLYSHNIKYNKFVNETYDEATYF